MSALIVLATGPSATVQDRGRPGQARLGISPSGAADRGALALGNRLVGNRADAAGLEVTLGGLSVRADGRAVIALTGADASATVTGHAIGSNATVTVEAGAVLTLGVPSTGLRTYLAVRGGIDVPAVLGSRSWDHLAGIGPPALQSGDCLPVGPATGPLPAADWAPVAPFPVEPTLHCRWGPRADRLTADARRQLELAAWTVTPELNRIAVRLTGPPLARADVTELLSEGIVRGAIQLPADGQPLLFLADHPTTGGYPVIAVVDDADTDAIAQLRPGQLVRLRPG